MAEKQVPSRVVHVRDVPEDANELDIIHFGAPFGPITNVILLKNANQAFLEMASLESATALVNSSKSPKEPSVRGKKVSFKYSKHQVLKSERKHSKEVIAALEATQTSKKPQKAAVSSQPGVNNILKVTIKNHRYLVSLDVLHKVFSRCGYVMKIVTFVGNDQLQALIEYADVKSAKLAKETLDGRNIYHESCTLLILYSDKTSLVVVQDSPQARDFSKYYNPENTANNANTQEKRKNQKSGKSTAENVTHEQIEPKGPLFRSLDFLVVPHFQCFNWEDCLICLKREFFYSNQELKKRMISLAKLSEGKESSSEVIESLEKKNSELRDKLTLSKKEMKNLREKMKALEADLDEANNKIAELENKEKNNMEIIESLQTSVFCLNEENANIKSEKAELEEILQNTSGSLQESKVKIVELNQCLAEKTDIIEGLEKKCSNIIKQWSCDHGLLPVVEEGMRGYMFECIRLNAALKEKDEEIKCLQKSLSAIRSQYKSSFTEMKSKIEEYSSQEEFWQNESEILKEKKGPKSGILENFLDSHKVENEKNLLQQEGNRRTDLEKSLEEKMKAKERSACHQSPESLITCSSKNNDFSLIDHLKKIV